VERRIPSDAFFTGGNSSRNKQLNGWNKLADALQLSKKNLDSDDFSSDGASADGPEDDNEDSDSMPEPLNGDNYLLNQSNANNASSSLTLIDHLSGLFNMINSVCEEQFEVIRKIFPPHAIARVTRLLIQRIFNDPAFGIQARVDSILIPQPPRPQLPLSDYLDALVTVREKLSALNLMLIEYCSHPAMKGMGSEAAVKQSRLGKGDRSFNRRHHATHRKNLTTAGDDVHEEDDLAEDEDDPHTANADDEEIEENLRSDAEIREFFDEQVLTFANA